MKSVRRLIPYLRPYFPHFFGSVALAIPLAALRTSPAVLVKHFVDDLLVQKKAGALALFPVFFIGLYLVNFIVRFFHFYLMRIVVARVEQKIKNDLFDHLMVLSADHFTAQRNGALISRVGSDPSLVSSALTAANAAIREPFNFLMLFAYSLFLNWRLTLLTFLVFPPLAWVFARTARNLKRYIQRMAEENANLFSLMQESFTGFRVIKAFRLERYLREKFFARSEGYASVLLKTAVLEEASHPMVELLTAFIIAAVVYYGGAQVIAGQMTSGDLLAFFVAFAMMMNPIRLMNDVNIRMSQAEGACERIFEILDWKSSLKEAVHPVELVRFEKAIEFNDVRFAYPDAPEREVLKGVSFEVPKGQTVAVIGASGAGKSSLVSLLPRIFDVTAGAIRIDGGDIRDFTLSSLRAQIAVVSQDVFLFNDTVRENIRCGRLDAAEEEILEAAQRAHAMDFIQKMPQGLDSVIGDRGQKLSGGERQRLSIARAFLSRSPILILDEATSSLDSASEKVVQRALDELMKDRTTLIIAHRLSTVRDASLIIVLKDGQIAEAGGHQELLARGGEYARFHHLGQATSLAPTVESTGLA